jgi:Domain of unknown function (DUF4386)
MKRITAAAVITGPLVFLIANVLHPKEYGRDHEREQLKEIAEHYTRWQLAHFLTFVSLMLFVLAICGLAWLLYSRRERSALLGGALGLCGLVAIGGVLALDGFTWGALGQVSTWPGTDQNTIENALHSVQQARWNLPFYVGSLAWLIGLAVVSWGLVREQMVPAWAGWTFVLGVVLVGVETAVQNNVYFIVAAAVLAIGGAGLAAAINRSPTIDAI